LLDLEPPRLLAHGVDAGLLLDSTLFGFSSRLDLFGSALTICSLGFFVCSRIGLSNL
jgi:hypothetical protein